MIMYSKKTYPWAWFISYMGLIAGALLLVFQITDCIQTEKLVDCVKDGNTIEKCENIQSEYNQYYR